MVLLTQKADNGRRPVKAVFRGKCQPPLLLQNCGCDLPASPLFVTILCPDAPGAGQDQVHGFYQGTDKLTGSSDTASHKGQSLSRLCTRIGPGYDHYNLSTLARKYPCLPSDHDSCTADAIPVYMTSLQRFPDSHNSCSSLCSR